MTITAAHGTCATSDATTRPIERKGQAANDDLPRGDLTYCAIFSATEPLRLELLEIDREGVVVERARPTLAEARRHTTELEAKRHHSELGYFARSALRMLDDLRMMHGRLDRPLPVGVDGGTVRVLLDREKDKLAFEFIPAAEAKPRAPRTGKKKSEDVEK